ncbi:MAG: glycosyltransferase family 1 protein [Methanophagales archaeon ANME-1-THS]|nr:MAG: glycosyltransferase family 1 protein [Methanophagales archaeon ANME-1-THS]
MRIGFFVAEYPPRTVSGVGLYAASICQALKNRGHVVSVFTMNDGTLKVRETVQGVDVNRPLLVNGSIILPQLLTRDDLPISGTGIKFFNDVLIYNILSATKFVNQFMKKEGLTFDMIAAHDWLTGIAGIMVKQETGLPFVFHLHSNEGVRSPLGHGSRVIRHIEKTAAQVADRVITVCYPRSEYLVMRGFDPTKMTVCWNAIDLARYDPRRVKPETIRALRSRYGIKTDEKMLLFVGGLAQIGGVVNLVKAMQLVTRAHPEAKLVILGIGEFEPEISNLITDLDLGDKITTRFEVVTEEERIIHYGACDAVICSTLNEPCSIISLEAMAMKKPVILGCKGICCSCDQIVASGDKQTGVLIDGSNCADLAWEICNLLKDIRKAREMGKRGRKRVERYLSGDTIADYTIAVYEDVIHEVRTKQRAQPLRSV